jgi:hypothetical protein
VTEFSSQIQVPKAVPKYNTEQEQKTPHPYWELDIDNIRVLVADTSDTVKGALDEFPEDDRELDQLHGAAVRLP